LRLIASIISGVNTKEVRSLMSSDEWLLIASHGL
jgi:trehalose-6-phosphatase